MIILINLLLLLLLLLKKANPGWDGFVQYFKLEDVAMGMWIEEYQRQTHIHVEFMDDKLFVNMGCEPNYVIAHYQSPPEMHCLWDLLLRGNFSCCHIDSEA
jgi:beta-1,3-galactosyltransferase